MDEKDRAILNLIIGLALGVLVTLLVSALTDDPVIEPPMQAHCELYDSKLVKYSERSFECENGARFMRYKIKEQGE